MPRAIWPDKPTDLSVDISYRYLNYARSGQFLSPIGYMRIAFGGYTFALIGMFLVTFLLSRISIKYKNTFMLSLILLVDFRFMIGGAPFDFYYGLVLALPFALVVLAVRAVDASREPVARRYSNALPRSSGKSRRAAVSSNSSAFPAVRRTLR